MQEILKLLPQFQDRIWGGTKLKDYFGYNIQSEMTGECWAISAHRNGDSIIDNGNLKGMHLSDVYTKYPQMFGNSQLIDFPIMSKILEANSNLSVQVHPNDEYAKLYENDLGKTECWYIIDCEKDAEIILGHHAKTKVQLEQMINNGEWDSLLRKEKIKPGDFFYVPSGTIHGLCKGTLVLEVQQSSDTTYRIYDYDRTDSSGNLRDLHIDKAINICTIPYNPENLMPYILENENNLITRYISNEFFTVEKWSVSGQSIYNLSNFTLINVIKGAGTINGTFVTIGDSMILTSICPYAELNGEMEIIASWTI